MDTTTPLDKVASEELLLGLSTQKSTETIGVDNAPEESLANSKSNADTRRHQQGEDNGIRHDNERHQISGPKDVKVLYNNEITTEVRCRQVFLSFILIVARLDFGRSLPFRYSRRVVCLVDI